MQLAGVEIHGWSAGKESGRIVMRRVTLCILRVGLELRQMSAEHADQRQEGDSYETEN